MLWSCCYSGWRVILDNIGGLVITLSRREDEGASLSSLGSAYYYRGDHRGDKGIIIVAMITLIITSSSCFTTKFYSYGVKVHIPLYPDTRYNTKVTSMDVRESLALLFVFNLYVSPTIVTICVDNATVRE